MAMSPLPSWGCPTPSTGTKMRDGHVAHMWAKWLHHLRRLGGSRRIVWGQKSEINFAHMWEKWLHHPCRLGGPHRQARGQKSEMSARPTCGQSGYITPAVLGVPNAQCGDKNQKWLCCPHVGKVATSPLLSWESSKLSAGTKIRHVCVADKWARWLHCPCPLGGPQC